MHKLLKQSGEWDIKLISKVRSFRYEIVIRVFISVLLAFLTEGILIAIACFLIKMTGKSLEPPIIKETIQSVPRFRDYLVYGRESIHKPPRYGLSDYISTVASAVLFLIVVVAVILFLFYFMVLTKKYNLYLKEIQLGIREISVGNFENKISVKYNSEFTVIAEQLNQMSNEIYQILCNERQTEDVKNELITSVAHDLRTPLTSIIGYLYLVSNKEDLEEEKKKQYIRIAYNKAKRLEQLLEDLFRYTKYSTDEGNLLARAVGNLVNNAIKYGKDGKYIKVTLWQEESYVVMSILNYGPVIPKENIAHLFERFYRVENSRSEETGGSGLGLAIAKQIITLHNGYIDVQSDYEGTVFRIKLKLWKKEGEEKNEN